MADPSPKRLPEPRRSFHIHPFARLVLVSLFTSLLLVGCGAVGSGATIPTALLLLWFTALSVSGFLVGCMNSAPPPNGSVPGSTSSNGVPSGLKFLTSPTKVTTDKVEAFVPITPAPQVAIVDSKGNTVTTATNTVHLLLANGSPTLSLSGTTTVNAVNGIATFDNVRINLAGANYALVATADDLDSAQSTAFVVDPLPPVFRSGQSRIDSAGGVTFGVARDANVSGDFNNDGKLDVATMGWGGGGNVVNVLLGDGLGGLDAGQGIPAATVLEGVAMATGDFNNDGNLDLVVSDPLYYSAHVLLGTGNGHFQAAVNYPVSDGVNAVAVGDFNNDGHRDIAFSLTSIGAFPAPGGTASVMMGNGDGTFEAAANYGPAAVGNGIAVGRFNSDGNDDLAVTQSNGQVQVLLGNGAGQFSAGHNLTVTTGAVTSPLAVQLTSSGATDLVISEPGAGLVWQLMGNGDGIFVTPTSIPVAGVTTVAPADLNADGQTDVVATLSSTRTGVLLNSNGTLAAQATTYPVSVINGVDVAPLPGDFNKDGKTDVVVSCASVETLLVGKGDGTFAEPAAQNAVGSENWTELKDVDGDGKLDLLSVGGAGLFGFDKGNGNGTFQTPPTTTPVGDGVQFATGDLNNDRKVDAVVACGPGTNSGVLVEMGNGQGTFTRSWVPTNTPSSGVAIGDFNRDYNPDIVASIAQSAQVQVFLGNGDGTFGSGTSITVGQLPQVPATGDFNRDNRLDIVVPDFSNGEVCVLLGNGDGTFRAPQNFAVINARAATVGDFNSDGKPDVAISAGYDGVTVMLGNGDGSFSPLGTYRGAIDAGNGQTVDFDGDGKLDLVLGSPTFQDVGVMLGNGDGSFQSPILIGTNATNNQAEVGDLQGDGKPDIVSPDNGNPTATVNMHQ